MLTSIATLNASCLRLVTSNNTSKDSIKPTLWRDATKWFVITEEVGDVAPLWLMTDDCVIHLDNHFDMSCDTL